MTYRNGKTITLGSGKVYISPYTGSTMPTISGICKSDQLLGYIKGGATLTYTAETYEEKDDLGLVSKLITTSEEAILKLGLITWNKTTLSKLIDRCKDATETETIDTNKYATTIKLGGAGNAQGTKWVVCFHHEDKADGDVWIRLIGNNTAGLTLTFAADAGTVLEPEFKALPHDEDGTLILFSEQQTK